MTEKQYELKEYDNGLFIQDNENNKVQYYSQSKASMNKIVDLLNELSELIKRLKTIREEQTEIILKQKRKIRELELCNQGKYIYGIHGGSNDRK